VTFHKAELTIPSTKNPAAGWHGWPADAPPPAIAPFDAEQAKQHQDAWARHLGTPVECENTLGMKFRLIPPGEFTMGTRTCTTCWRATRGLPFRTITRCSIRTHS
jgi:hypothetical protein